jgi:filamentous hemagglutinin family protein
MQCFFYRGLLISSMFTMVFGVSIPQGWAQNAITSDRTLPTNSQITFDASRQTYTIMGGTQVGANQFHSFQQFSVPSGNTAYFNNAPTTANIISRVTGGTASEINGTIRTNDMTNLYLINPQGIIFGANAKLEVGGSFTATAANSIKFPDGTEFSAVNPQAPPVLQVNVPLGLQYGTSAAGATITNRGVLSAGQNLTLQGDQLDLQGTVQAGQNLTLQGQDIKIRDTATAPFMANAGRDLWVQGERSIDIFTLNRQESGFKSGGDLTLISNGIISADSHFASRNFQIRSLSGQLANFRSLFDPIISSEGNVNLNGNYTGASLLIEAKGNVQITGDVTINSADSSSIFQGDDSILSKQPGLIIRSGQSSLLYGGNNQNYDKNNPNLPALTNTVNIPAGITLNGAVRVIPNVQGGVVQLTAATGGISVSGIDASNSYGNDGNGINVKDNISVQITAATGGITVANQINASNDNGNGGNIFLSTSNGNISARNTSSNSNNGNGGNITFRSNSGDIKIGLISTVSSSTTTNSGNGGNILVTAETGRIGTNNAQIALNIYSFSGIYLNTYSWSGAGNAGNAGNILISSGTGDITGVIADASAQSNTYNAGNGGNISLTATKGDITDVKLDSYAVASAALLLGKGNQVGHGGSVTLNAPMGSIKNTNINSLAANLPDGNSGSGGQVRLTVGQSLFSVIISTIATGSSSGEIQIRGNSNQNLNIINSQVLTAQEISVCLLLICPPSPRTLFILSGKGQAGDVTITSLGGITFNDFTIDSGTRGKLPGGTINITSSSFLNFSNSKISSNANSSASASAGSINLFAPQITLTNNTVLSAATSGSGNAGSISIGSGHAGNTFINGENLTMDQGSQIRTETSSSGRSGKITLQFLSKIHLDGSGTGLFANTLDKSSGDGGDIVIDPQILTVQNGAAIAVDSNGTGKGGNITIFSNYLNLFNGGKISAETVASDGGNITLNVPSLLFLRYGSQISTTAGTALSGGNGGNININAGFIVGPSSDNADLFANAFTGKGGNINLTTNGIFGLAFRPQLTNLSDITASSKFGVQGNVSITTPGVDPSKGLSSLPADVSDPSRLVIPQCAADQRGSQFIITGRGGIPAKPSDPATYTSALDNLGAIPSTTAFRNTSTNQANSEANSINSNSANNSMNNNTNTIMEATGWIINQNQVSLVAGAVLSLNGVTCAR